MAMNLYQKLVEVRKAAPYLQKANQGHQFKYVSSSQVLGTLRKRMDELGVLLIPKVVSHTLHDKYRLPPQERNDGQRDYAKEHITELVLEFTWVNAEKPEEQIVCPWYGQGVDSGEKGVGKALTYAEKYFMLKFFNVATDKDDPDAFQDKIDGEDTPPAPPQKPAAVAKPTPTASPARQVAATTEPELPPQQPPQQANYSSMASERQIKAIQAISKSKNVDYHTMLGSYGATSSKELTTQQASELIKWLNEQQ